MTLKKSEGTLEGKDNALVEHAHSPGSIPSTMKISNKTKAKTFLKILELLSLNSTLSFAIEHKLVYPISLNISLNIYMIPR